MGPFGYHRIVTKRPYTQKVGKPAMFETAGEHGRFVLPESRPVRSRDDSNPPPSRRGSQFSPYNNTKANTPEVTFYSSRSACSRSSTLRAPKHREFRPDKEISCLRARPQGPHVLMPHRTWLECACRDDHTAPSLLDLLTPKLGVQRARARAHDVHASSRVAGLR